MNDKENIVDEKLEDFGPKIIERGENYYKNGNIESVKGNGKVFIAKVKGTRYDPYEVRVEINEDDINLSCDCACDFNCKHEYAVLLAIKNDQYEELDIKPEITKKKDDLKEIISKIPAEELKEYLLNNIEENELEFDLYDFEEKFKQYIPTESYEYYYNKLYNELILEDDDVMYTLDDYLDNVKEYIADSKFEEVLKIINAIINAYNDSGKLDNDADVTEKFPLIAMYLRVTYRKCSNELRGEMDEWIDLLEKDNYYNNYYLEDAILGIK